jgi:hypothetical protein
VPRSITSFGFKDGFKEGTTFRGLSEITGVVYTDFFLEAGAGARAGTETATVTVVFGAVEIAGA